MKMKIAIIIVLFLVVGITGLRLWTLFNEEDQGVREVSTPVEIVEVTEDTYELTLDYQGRVAPEKIEKISFKSSGRLEEFNGSVGSVIQKGTVLVSLDNTDLTLALNAAKQQYIGAEADYNRASGGARDEDVSLALISRNKARDAVAYLENKVEDVRSLYQEGVVSSSEIEGLELEYNLAVNDLALAQKNYEKALNGTEEEMIVAALSQKDLAQINIDAQQRLLEDASYSLKSDMVLIQQLYEEGELIPAGYPVAVLRSLNQIVTLGVSAKDLENIHIGQIAVIDLNGEKKTGEVVRIAEVPDEQHFLYEMEISLEDSDYRIGDIVACSLVVDEFSVVSVPIGSIMNDGIDYVYVDVEGIVRLKKITILTIDEGMAAVAGLEIGDRLIISNLNRIHENSLVHIEE